MAQIFLHPQSDTQVIYLSYPSLEVDGKRVSTDQIQEWYELGHLIILKDFRLRGDFSLFANLDTDDSKQHPKKLADDFSEKPLKDFLRGLRKGGMAHPWKSLHFALETGSIRRQMLSIARTLFPQYKYLDNRITWRLTEQVNENLHIDTYGAREFASHQLRVFANLDTAKRIWNVGPKIDQVFEQAINAVPASMVAKGNLGEISSFMNATVFGRKDTRGVGEIPTSVAMFEPGEVWIVESRQVSHQVFYGRRAISTDISVDSASMRFPERHYLALTRKYVEGRKPSTEIS